MYFSYSGGTENVFIKGLRKSASLLLALFLFMSPINHIVHANLTSTDVNYTAVAETRGFNNEYQVSGYDGAYESSYAIQVPPGISAHTPSVALSYSSAAPSDHDIAGYGWSVSIPRISRVNKTGTEKLYSSDTFASPFSGELVKVSSIEYRPKVETGDFHKYVLENNTWTVTTKEGEKYVFGSTTSERQDDPSDSTKIYTWMLSREVDKNGNEISYTYTKDEDNGHAFTSTA